MTMVTLKTAMYQTTNMAEKNEKIYMYYFPLHDRTQEQNGSPYFSSIVRQCKWPCLSRKIVEIQTFCYHGNVTLVVFLINVFLDKPLCFVIG